jgi:site-specific recombinase XerD
VTTAGQEWHRATLDHLAWLAASGASQGSLRLRRHWLTRLSLDVACGPWEADEQQLVEFLASRPWSPETRKSARTAVRMFYSWAYDQGLVDVDPARRLPTVRIPATVPNPCPDDVIRSALERADARERLMVLLAATAGLRCIEIAKVHTGDVVRRDDGWWLRVTGKGGRTRAIPLGPPLSDELPAMTAGYLFPGPISAAHVGKLVERLLGGGWSAHKLRHRFATAAYAQSRDLLAVQQLLGHSKPGTTQRYTALPGDALRTAVASIGVGSARWDASHHGSA